MAIDTPRACPLPPAAAILCYEGIVNDEPLATFIW